MEMPEGWNKRLAWAQQVKEYKNHDLIATGYDYEQILNLMREMAEVLEKHSHRWTDKHAFGTEFNEAGTVLNKFKEWK